MPIYEFACPKCRVIFSFLSKRINPDRKPVCPKCGNRRMSKEISRFAMIKAGSSDEGGEDSDVPDLDDPRVMQAISEIERDLGRMDEKNSHHMAHVMKKIKDIMPYGAMPKELDAAIKRLEKGEDIEKIEEDMGDVFGEMFGSEGMGGGKAGAFSRDETLYDY